MTSWLTFAFGALAVIAGACGPIQATINGTLAADVSSGIVATAISVSASTAYLFVSLLLWPPSATAKTKQGVKPWMFSSGILMPCYVGSIIQLKSYLGMQVIVSCLLCGQLAAAVTLDHIGFAGGPLRRLTTRRAVGVFLAAIGCALMQLRGQRVPTQLVPLLPLAAAVGGSLPVQSALNTRLASHIGGARRSSVAVCAIGSCVLWLVVCILHLRAQLPPQRRTLLEVPLWESAGGGLLGLAGIAVLIAGPRIGMARYYTLQISGQLCSSALLQARSEASASALPDTADMLLQLLALAFSAAGNAAILFSDTSDSAPSAGSRNLSIAADERKKRS